MSAEQLEKIMRRARELSDRISSAESGPSARADSGSDFDSASASDAYSRGPRSAPAAGQAFETRQRYVQEPFFAPLQALPPRAPGRLPEGGRTGLAAVVTEVRVAQNLGLLLRRPCAARVFVSAGGRRVDVARTHVVALGADAGQARLSLTLRVTAAGDGADEGPALFEQTQTVAGREELAGMLSGISGHSVQLLRSAEVPFFYEAEQLQILVGAARLLLVGGSADRVGRTRFRPPFLRLSGPETRSEAAEAAAQTEEPPRPRPRRVGRALVQLQVQKLAFRPGGPRPARAYVLVSLNADESLQKLGRLSWGPDARAPGLCKTFVSAAAPVAEERGCGAAALCCELSETVELTRDAVAYLNEGRAAVVVVGVSADGRKEVLGAVSTSLTFAEHQGWARAADFHCFLRVRVQKWAGAAVSGFSAVVRDPNVGLPAEYERGVLVGGIGGVGGVGGISGQVSGQVSGQIQGQISGQI